MDIKIFQAAVVVGLLAPAAAAQVVNGSFEDPALSGPNRASISTLADWNSQGGFMLLERGVNNISNLAAHSGDQFVSIGHSGASNDRLFQTLVTVPGTTYEVSYWITTIQGNQLQELTASVLDGTSQAVLGSVVGEVDQAEDGWVQYSFGFTATSEASVLEFVHTRSSGFANMALDSVEIVPSPSAAALIGLGGVMAGRRRR